MTLNDAVKVLNKHGHRGLVDWFVIPEGDRGPGFVDSRFMRRNSDEPASPVGLDAFAAVAVAEKLDREAGRDMPATRRLIEHLKSLFSERARAFYGPCSHWFHDPDGKALALGEIDAALAEWADQSNPSTETDA